MGDSIGDQMQAAALADGEPDEDTPEELGEQLGAEAARRQWLKEMAFDGAEPSAGDRLAEALRDLAEKQANAPECDFSGDVF